MTNNKTTDLINIDNELIASEAEKIVQNVAIYKGSTKKQRFYMYRLFGLPIKLCAKLSGYSVGYGYQLNWDLKNDPKVARSVEQILSDIPDKYKNICKMRLLQVSDIEGKALQEYENDPKLAIDKPQLLKQVKQAGGVDLNETAPSPKAPTINIAEFKLFHQSLLPDHPDKPKTIDAEVIEDSPSTKR